MKIKIPLEFDLQGLLKRLTRKFAFRGVGLFIGKEFVDLVELRRTFSGPRLVNFVSVPIARTPAPPSQEAPSPGAQAGAVFPTHEQLLSAIRRALRDSGIRGRKVISTLSEEEVIVRYFQMPRLPRKDWDQAVRFEARKYIPFTLEELISDFSVFEDKKEKGKMNVVFVAAKKEVVAHHLALFTKASLRIAHLEALPISFTRLLYTLEPSTRKEKCICVVDIDGPTGSIILLKEGFPYLVRRLSLKPQAEEEAAPTLPPLVEKLLDEVRLTSRYYRNQFPGESINRVLIFGDGVKPEIPEILSRELSLPVTLEDLSRIAGKRGIVPLRLARTVGLGLRNLTEGGIEIDLLPPQQALGSSKQTKLLRTLLLEGVGTIMVLTTLVFILSHRVTLQKKVVASQKEKQKLAGITVSKAELSERKTILSQRASFYQNLYDGRLFWTKKLNELGHILPKGAWITKLELEDYSDEELGGGEIYRLTLKGMVYASDKAEELRLPSQFLVALQQNPEFFEGFSAARLVSVKREMVEEVPVTSFEILLTGVKK